MAETMFCPTAPHSLSEWMAPIFLVAIMGGNWVQRWQSAGWLFWLESEELALKLLAQSELTTFSHIPQSRTTYTQLKEVRWPGRASLHPAPLISVAWMFS